MFKFEDWNAGCMILSKNQRSRIPKDPVDSKILKSTTILQFESHSAHDTNGQRSSIQIQALLKNSLQYGLQFVKLETFDYIDNVFLQN